MEATTLLSSQRPTSARFLNADRSNPWVQTSSGSCTKRLKELVLGSNLAEGREWGRSVPLRYQPLTGHGRGPGVARPLGARLMQETERCDTQG
jgi:hypothetical protein